MLGEALILLAVLALSYANGANDNFKGVATLLGSGTTNYRKAILWATIMTLAGSLAAAFWAQGLIHTFSGKGLVPYELTTNTEFLLAVALGAAVTVLIATFTGIPISTTHSLTGALFGAGLVAVGSKLGFSALGKNFFLPLVISPFIAVVLTVFIYPFFKFIRIRLGVNRNTCICFREKKVPVPALAMSGNATISLEQIRSFGIDIDAKEVCEAKLTEEYSGYIFGLEAKRLLDWLHFLSAGAVSFARGLNDAPKIAALALAAGMSGLKVNLILVAIAMGLGGLLSARKIAQTMSFKITRMNHGQGLTANLITALLVIFASRLGVPVSTTHVSCGSLFGIGLVSGRARWKTIGGIAGAWILTLPLAALLSALFYIIGTDTIFHYK